MATIIKKYEFDALTGQEKITDFTETDFAMQKQLENEENLKIEEEKIKSAAKEELLKKLGITNEEVKLLLS